MPTNRADHAPDNVIVDLLRRVKVLEEQIIFLRNAQNPTIPFYDWTDSAERPDIVEQQIFYSTDDGMLNVYVGGARQSVLLT